MGPRLSLAQGHPGTGRSLGGHWAGTRGHCGPWEPWGPGDGDPASPIPIQGLIPPPPGPVTVPVPTGDTLVSPTPAGPTCCHPQGVDGDMGTVPSATITPNCPPTGDGSTV